jgi:hypothetical protein
MGRGNAGFDAVFGGRRRGGSGDSKPPKAPSSQDALAEARRVTDELIQRSRHERFGRRQMALAALAAQDEGSDAEPD